MLKTTSRRALAEIALALLTVIALAVGLYAAAFRLMPHRYDFGAVWESYLEEPRDTADVLFFGSSICYCDVMPAAIYRESGLTSFVMAGPEQTPEVMLCYVREACRTQRPQCVVAEITGAFFDRYTGYSKVNVGYMPFSVNRVRAGLACEEGMLRLALFPIYDFHSELLAPQLARSELTADDGRMLCGYTLLTDTASELTPGDREGLHLPGTEAYETHAQALEQLISFCRDEGIELVCYFSPAVARVPDDARRTLTERLTASGCEAVWDLTDAAASMGVDDADWYDNLHFNRFGAEKFSADLAARLTALGVTPSGRADETLWQRRVDYLFPEN